MGLINGSRWLRLRNNFNPTFHHAAVVKKTGDVIQEARQYMQQMTQQQAETGSFQMKASDAVARFPFFYTAKVLYGDLNDKEKHDLWELGQRSYRLMGYLLRGGLYRFNFAPTIYKEASHELQAFSQTWEAFNQDMYESRKKGLDHPLIISAWQQVIDREVTRDEVS